MVLLLLVNLLLLVHFVSRDDGEAAPSAGGSSQGSAIALLVKALSTRKAKMGDRSNPPRGGMTPLNKFKYGSHKVLRGLTMTGGAVGNQVSTRRRTRTLL